MPKQVKIVALALVVALALASAVDAKLTVTTLSAITADLGAVSAGSINLNGGAFVLNSNGDIFATNFIGTTAEITNLFLDNVATRVLSSSDTITVGGDLIINSLSGGGSTNACVNNSGTVYRC